MVTRFLSIFIFFCAFSSPSLAWNEFGHMLVAEAALSKLDPELQRKIELQSFELVKKQASDKRLYLMRAFPGTSAFAHMSVFADNYRNLSLAELYETYASSLPDEFAGISDQDTSTWHYKNLVYQNLGSTPPFPLSEQNTQSCEAPSQLDVVWAIESLKEIYRSSEHIENQTLTLALLIHFVSDAHQPLHAMSRYDEDCESDRGGNALCVSYRKNSYSCEQNLHSLWDSALGFFENFDQVSDAAEFVSRVEVDELEAANLDPQIWVEEGHRQARFVYSIKDGSGGDEFYISEGQIIAYERLALAAERLSRILNDLY